MESVLVVKETRPVASMGAVPRTVAPSWKVTGPERVWAGTVGAETVAVRVTGAVARAEGEGEAVRAMEDGRPLTWRRAGAEVARRSVPPRRVAERVWSPGVN